MTVMLLIMPLTSCVVTKYVEKTYVPEITFPTFPSLPDCERKDGKVIVPEEWIVRLAEYSIRIDETECTYNDLRTLFMEGDKEESADVGR